jgi:hypothetical protein
MAKKSQDKAPFKFAKIKPDVHAKIMKESDETHRDFWAILDEVIRLGIQQRDGKLAEGK